MSRTKEQQARFEELTRTLSKEEYDAVEVPTAEQFREALRKGAEELREARRYNGGVRFHRCPRCNHRF